MDDVLIKRLIRHIKWLKFWIAFFGTLLFVSLAILSFLAYKLITFARDATGKLDKLQQQTSQVTSPTSQACGSSSYSVYLKQAGLCK